MVRRVGIGPRGNQSGQEISLRLRQPVPDTVHVHEKGGCRGSRSGGLLGVGDWHTRRGNSLTGVGDGINFVVQVEVKDQLSAHSQVDMGHALGGLVELLLFFCCDVLQRQLRIRMRDGRGLPEGVLYFRPGLSEVLAQHGMVILGRSRNAVAANDDQECGHKHRQHFVHGSIPLRGRLFRSR